MNKLLTVGKFLDQPRLINNFSKVVPSTLVAGGCCYTYVHVKNAPEGQKKKTFIKNVSVLATTITAALSAPKLAEKSTKAISKFFSKNGNGHSHGHESQEFCEKKMGELIDSFLDKKQVSPDAKTFLQKAKKQILMPSEIKTIYSELKKDKEGEEFLRKFIPDPENIDSKHIFGEIGRLSIMGAITVLGGIAGGMLGDKLTGENLKETIPNKIKEGSYQFLANIFMCNIGAGAALCMMEGAAKKYEKYQKEGIPNNALSKFNHDLIKRLNPQSKITRAITMTGGIILTGIIFGSAIANIISNKIIDPIFSKNEEDSTTAKTFNFGHRHRNQGPHQNCQKRKNCQNRGIYSERKPEMLDVGLHADDIATVAVLSGLKWIEPSLPILYSISGFRAGIGYRNGDK